MPKLMSAEDYRGSKLRGGNSRTGQRGARGDGDVPPPAARFLRYLIHVGADPARVAAILDAIEADASTSPRDDATT